MTKQVDHLARIVERKAVEIERRLRRRAAFEALARRAPPADKWAATALRREPGQPPKVIAEIKLRSPSAGQIRARKPGELARIGQAYQQGGAAAISVLCDGPGFGGSPLDLRRVVRSVSLPVLFKEFVLHPVQLDCARACGATLVLLLVRVLSDVELESLIAEARARGLEPVVEAADDAELTRALASSALIVGVNARDLRSFTVDADQAATLVARIPGDRLAVFMSGVRSRRDYARVGRTRADAVLIGEGLMRAEEPGLALADLLAAPASTT